MISRDAHVMVAPAAALRAAVGDSSAPNGWWGALSRPALVALTVGVVTAVWSTGKVTWSLVLSDATCWSFVPAVQVVVAWVVLTLRRPPMNIAKSLSLFFLGHGPWTLWLLGVAAWSTVSINRRTQVPVLLTSLVPAAWTAFIVFEFFRTVFHDSRRDAFLRTCLHQSLICLVIGTYITLTNQLWPRLVGMLHR
jgi:hypothetical protein